MTVEIPEATYLTRLSFWLFQEKAITSIYLKLFEHN